MWCFLQRHPCAVCCVCIRQTSTAVFCAFVWSIIYALAEVLHNRLSCIHSCCHPVACLLTLYVGCCTFIKHNMSTTNHCFVYECRYFSLPLTRFSSAACMLTSKQASNRWTDNQAHRQTQRGRDRQTDRSRNCYIHTDRQTDRADRQTGQRVWKGAQDTQQGGVSYLQQGR